MTALKISPFVRSGNAALALWQSVVANVARHEISRCTEESLTPGEIHARALLHKMVLGTNVFVDRKNRVVPDVAFEEFNNTIATAPNHIHEALINGYLSQFYFNAVMAVLEKRDASVPSHPPEFPESDYAYVHWVKAALDWLAHRTNPFEPPSPYIDWQKSGKDINTFGVITIPENARIALIGDFGTGLPDATIMLMALIRELQPDFIIHLGDIYYSGTEAECEVYTQVFSDAFTRLGISPIPVFSIPGNHEYLSEGLGFFKHVIGMNANNNLGNYNQEASYFCLRTAENNWQLLGMDTGLNSVEGNVFTILTNAYPPALQPSEVLWHANKLDNFGGKTILLSHHQLFSASAVIDSKTKTYINPHLQATFAKYYKQVAAWFWGHEHILGIFADDTKQTGLAKGRLVGNSGYEEWGGEDAYNTVANPAYPYLSPVVKVDTDAVTWKSKTYQFYEHGFALIQLQGAAATVDYYQYPVMVPDAPIPAPNQLQPLKKINFTDSL
ncbi:MAG: metallophosphoesterase [Mucilaginibacter sp.]